MTAKAAAIATVDDADKLRRRHYLHELLMRGNTTGIIEHGAGGADAIETAAHAAAATLNREALYITYETNYAMVQNEPDELRNVKDVLEENKRVKLKLANAKREMEGVDESKEEMKGLVSGEEN